MPGNKGHKAGRFEDELDRVLAHANPNPGRIGCLPREALASLAARRQPLNAPGYEHLLECSECYREFRSLQSGEVADLDPWIG
jgi:hypothetical protein